MQHYVEVFGRRRHVIDDVEDAVAGGFDRRLAAEAPTSRMILTVHDELLFEAPVADADRVAALVRDYSDPGHVVVDPFAGWGSTLVAARNAVSMAQGAVVAAALGGLAE